MDDYGEGTWIVLALLLLRFLYRSPITVFLMNLKIFQTLSQELDMADRSSQVGSVNLKPVDDGEEQWVTMNQVDDGTSAVFGFGLGATCVAPVIEVWLRY